MSISRYEEAPTNIQRLVNNMQNKKFKHMIGDAKIKVLLDRRPKKTKGKYRLGELRLPDEFTKFFSSMITDENHPPDFVMIMDKALVEKVEKKDTKRIVFHELCHGLKDNNGKYKVVPHDFEGFYEEIEYNKDDPDWNLRLANEMEILYEEE